MSRKKRKQTRQDKRKAPPRSEDSTPEQEMSHEDFWGGDGVTLRGNISVRSPVPVKIDGLTIYGNVDADKNTDLTLSNLWVKSGGNPMTGKMKIGFVRGNADVSDNKVAGDIEINSVMGDLKAVRNQVGQSTQHTVDELLDILQSEPTTDKLASLESRFSELEKIVASMEANSPGAGRSLLTWLRVTSLRLLSNESATGIITFIQEQLEDLAGP